jgi:hypothetical protein
MAELKILTLSNLYIHRTCTQLHSFAYPKAELNRPQHNNHPLWAAEFHDHSTRYSGQKHQYIPREASHYATRHWKIWNSIPEQIRRERKRGAFKRALKEHLLRTQ